MSRAPALERLLTAALWAGLAAGGALFLAVGWSMLTYPHEVVVSEGAIGWGVKSLLGGVPPYTMDRFAGEPYVVLHYTPLYYLLVAPLMAWSDAPYGAGRFVSIVFTLLTAACAARTAYRLTGRREAAALAPLVWLSFYQVVFWGTAQRVDAPGIFFEAVGLASVLALRARDPARTPWVSLPWFLLAWGTKQVMVVGLLAVTADLLVRDLKRGIRFGAAALGLLAAIVAVANLASHGAFWRATVLATVSAKADAPWVVFSNAELFFGSPWSMLLFVIAGSAALARRERLLGIYLVLGLAAAVATDANLPRFFPPMLAMALLVPMALLEAEPRPALRKGLVAVLVFFCGAHLLYEMRSLVRERIVQLTPDNGRLAMASALMSMTPEGGRILAQDLGLVLSAKRTPAVADPLVLSILAGNGAWDPKTLERAVDERRYDAIVLNRPLEALDDREWTTLWIAPVRGAIARRYRLADTLHCDQEWRFLEPDRYVYVPSPEAP